MSGDWFSFPSLSSTNDKALELAKEGVPTGTVVIADEQTAGRGRRGRHWFCPEGSLALSVVHRPTRALEEVASLTPCVAVGLTRALDTLGFEPTIKWPNDLLIGGRKVAGILCELHHVGGAPVVVVGVGLNVNVTQFPEEVADVATSLAQHGNRGLQKLDAVAERVAGEIRVALSQHDAGDDIPTLFAERLHGVGSPVSIDGSETMVGTLMGVRLSDGALRVMDQEGQERLVTSGEIVR